MVDPTVVRRSWRHPIRPRPIHALARVIAAFARAYPAASFVQIGSNDGAKYDPLRQEIDQRKWQGVLVEPVPYIFKRLVAHRGGHDRLVLENVAIAKREGRREFFYLPELTDPSLPDWYDALGSFRREVIERHGALIPGIEDHIQVIEVPTISFEGLCERNHLERIDLVHIDTEGFDYEIIKLIDLDRHRPTVLLYEHYHLDPAERVEAFELVRGHGYEHLSNGMDTLCLRVGAGGTEHPRLRRLWRKLRAEAAFGDA